VRTHGTGYNELDVLRLQGGERVSPTTWTITNFQSPGVIGDIGQIDRTLYTTKPTNNAGITGSISGANDARVFLTWKKVYRPANQ
jgi:hypothetical protein